MADLKTGLSSKLSTLLPSWGRREIIGLSVEGNDLRLICVRERAIVRFVSSPLDPNLIPGGVVAQPAAFGAAIRKVLVDYELKPSYVIAGFQDAEAESALTVLPKKSGADIEQVVQREAWRELQLDNTRYRLFHQVVAENSVEMSVFLLAVRRAALADYMEGMRLAGVRPAMVNLRPLAMIRAVNQPHIIIAHVERTSVDLVIVSNNLPVFMRTTPLDNGDDVADVIGTTIDEYNSDPKNNALNPRLPVALSGEMSAMPDVQESIQTKLNRPLSAASCPFAAPAGFDVANFLVSIGLVLKAR